MGVSRDPREFLNKVNSLPDAMETIAEKAIRANAKTARENALKEARKAAGGDLILGHAGALLRAGDGRVVGRKGARLNVTDKPVQGVAGWRRVSAEGPWPLINNDLEAHEVFPAGYDKELEIGPVPPGQRRKKTRSGRAGAKTRAGRSKALRTPLGPRRRAFIPRIRGKRIWQRAQKQTERQVEGTVKKLAQDELRKRFG